MRNSPCPFALADSLTQAPPTHLPFYPTRSQLLTAIKHSSSMQATKAEDRSQPGPLGGLF